MVPQTLFISDLHLEEPTPATTATFLRFLTERAISADALYILGDFFEAWIGDDDQSDFNTQIIQALKQLTDQGVPVYFMHGNRDFLIGRRFIKATGMTLLPDPTTIELYGKAVLLMHGDSLCTLDKHHQLYRKFSLNPVLQTLFLMLPLRFRQNIASKMRKKSKNHNANAPRYITDVTQEAVQRMMKRHKTTLLIHGHTHRPDIHRFMLNNQRAERIVLGAWHESIKILAYQKDGSYTLETIQHA